MQSAEVKLRQRQSSPVRHSAVQFSLLKGFPAQSSPLRRRVLQSSLIRSSLLSGVCSRSAQSSPVPFKSIRSRPIPVIPFHLSTFQSRIAQVHISQQQSSLVQSSAVQSSAIRNTSAHFRFVQSRTNNCRWVYHNAVLLSQVRNNQVHCGPPSQVKCYLPTFKRIQVYFSPVLSSVVTPTHSRASTYGIVIDRSFLMVP